MLSGIIFLFVSIILLSLTSFVIITLLNIKEKISIFLAWFVLSWTQVVAGIELFSIFRIVKAETIFFWHVLLLSIALLYMWSQKISLPKISVRIIVSEIREFISQRFERIVTIFILFIFISTFLIAYLVPSNTWDSMTYHMPRAAYWYQHGTIDHFFTNNARQNVNPIVAEAGILWTMLFVKSDLFANMIQWMSLVASCVALYGVCRQLGFNRKVSLMTILTFLSLPMVILQASTTQNDMVIAAFVMIAAYFTFVGLRAEVFCLPYLLLAGLSLGLAIGTKGYALFFLPGFFIFALLTIFKSSSTGKSKRFFIYIICCISGIFLFSAYTWIENLQSYGNLFSDGGSMEMVKVINPNLSSLISNAFRNWGSFFDIPITYLQNIVYNIIKSTHFFIGTDISSGKTTFGSYNYTVSQVFLQSDSAYFGPLGFFLIWPAMIGIVFITMIKLLKKQKINTELFNVMTILLLSLSFYVVYSFLLKWQPWGGRMLIAFVLSTMPAVALVYANLSRYKKLPRQIFLGFVIASMITTSFFDLFLNYNSPIIPIGIEKTSYSINNFEILPATPYISIDRTIIKMNRTQRRFIYYPSGYSTFELVNQKIPDNGRLGLMIGGDDWEYPLFGDRLERKIFQIPEDKLINNGIAAFMNDMNLDGILIRKSTYSDLLRQHKDGFEFYESGDFILFTRLI